MQIKKHTLGSAWIIILIFSSTLLWAQNEPYNGGFGSGDNNQAVSLANCSNFRFAGGFGESNSSSASSLLSCSSFRFGGGFGDGDSSTNSALLTCGTFRFAGGFGDGDSSVRSSLLSCNTFRFAGDTADGFAISNTNLLNCNLFRFAGDSGSGYIGREYIKPRNFLGNDTSITIICSNDTYNLLGLYNFNGITLAWNTATPAAAIMGNYQVVGTTTGGCKDTAFTVIKQEINTWNGSVNNDWHTAANWNNNHVPTEITHVIIQGGTPNPCVISNADAKAASVQGKIAGNFSIINNKNLLISGHCVSLPTGQ
ncbi:MAG: hypothetical protein IPP72_11495 [Chitinophagaceae bacterium]|nr:hypothetical protein [Chitinophagaceae bacterium]